MVKELGSTEKVKKREQKEFRRAFTEKMKRIDGRLLHKGNGGKKIASG